MITNAVVVILISTLYTSIAKKIPLRRGFAEMADISLGTTRLTFVIGFIIRAYFEVEA